MDDRLRGVLSRVRDPLSPLVFVCYALCAETFGSFAICKSLAILSTCAMCKTSVVGMSERALLTRGGGARTGWCVHARAATSATQHCMSPPPPRLPLLLLLPSASWHTTT
eukprot:2651789-Rhodomonas_salina.1